MKIISVEVILKQPSMEFLLANDPLSFRNNNQGTDVVLMQWLSELCRNRKWTTREEIHRTIKMVETLCAGDDDKNDSNSKLSWALLGKVYEKAQRSLTTMISPPPPLAGNVLYPSKDSSTQKTIMEYQMFWILVHAFPRILCLSSCQPKFLVKNWKEFLQWIGVVNLNERSFSIGTFLRQQRSSSDIVDLVHQVEGRIMKLIACYQQHKQEHRHEYLDPFLGAIPGGHRHGRTFSDGGIRPAGASGGLF